MINGMNRGRKRGIRRKPEPVDMAAILRTPAPQAGAAVRPIAKLTPYAERLLARSNATPPGTPPPAPADGWITTEMAAKLTGFSRRHIYTLCENGFFVEGKEWWQRGASPRAGRAGKVLIRRAALKKLEAEW